MVWTFLVVTLGLLFGCLVGTLLRGGCAGNCSNFGFWGGFGLFTIDLGLGGLCLVVGRVSCACIYGSLV